MTAVAYGQARSADVLYTYFDDAPVHGFRVIDECFVSVEDASRFGWQVTVHKDQADVTAEGLSFTLGVRVISGHVSIPIRAGLMKLGGSADWITNTDTLQVVSELTSVKYESGKVRVTSPLLIKPKAIALTNPDRMVIDYIGAKIGTKTVQTLEGGVRLSQYKPNVVRLVIQTPNAADAKKISTEPTKNSVVELSEATTEETEAKPAEPVPIDTKPTPIGTISTAPVPAAGTPQMPAYLPISLDKEDSHSLQMSIKLPGLKNQAEFKKPDPSTLEISLPGVFLEMDPDFKLVSDSVSMARSEKTASGTLVTLYLNRPLGAEVLTDKNGVSIQLFKPNVGNGKLAGKIIVVDPGHGGQDSGAHEGGCLEKNLTLVIAKYLANYLAEEGATVIMTRKSDVFIPLTTRADIANQNRADLFLSCHINDSGGSHNMAGTITFHHKGNAICRVLADCIQQEIAKVSGIPNTGVWSDGKIYPQSGFSVLRNTKMVGVLIEFGFIDNSQDRKKLITDQFQQSVARAVVQGVKVYLGDAKTN